MKRSDGHVGYVHRHLCNAIFIYIPTDSFGPLECTGLHDCFPIGVLERLAGNFAAFTYGTSFLTHIERDGVGATRGGRVEVIIYRNQKITGSDSGSAGACGVIVKRTVAHVSAFAFVTQLVGKRLILSGTAHGKILALGNKSGCLITVNRDMQLVGHAPGKTAGKFDTLGESNAAHRYQRTHIGSPHAGMSAVVLAHVDKLSRPRYAAESRLDHRLGFSDKSDYCAVGRLPGINIKQFDIARRSNTFGDSVYYCAVAPLAEIGYTLYQTFFHVYVRLVYLKYIMVQIYEKPCTDTRTNNFFHYLCGMKNDASDKYTATSCPLRIVVTGTRGIPDIQGGVETHCEELYPRLAAMGNDVTVIRRTPYVTDDNRRDSYRGVKLLDVYAPRRKSIEAIVHTFLAVLAARRMNPDVLHIHAIGPSIMVPMARMLGIKVVTTNHGPDYDRQKWGRMAKTVLRLGERCGARFSNAVIVISDVICNILADKYGRLDTHLIFNGVNSPEITTEHDYTDSLGLVPGRYIVALGRFVKEKGFHDLIAAFAKSAPEGWRLAIAGDADHPDAYSTELKRRAAKAGVVLTGFIRGRRLNQLMSHAGLYAMPSYHEGLPIALLEALSYGLDSIVSDIPANRLPVLTPDDFFPTGDVDALATKITEKTSTVTGRRTYDLSAYDWDTIARQTLDVYRSVARR